MQWSASEEPHHIWPRLLEFDAQEEIQKARLWLPRVLSKTPCPFPIRGIYFGLGEYESKRVEYADMYFGLMGTFDSADTKSKWLWASPRCYPESARLKSKALKIGGLLCNQDRTMTGLGTNGYICFSVGFAVLLLRHTLDSGLFQLLGGSEPIGIVTGFDSGDLVRLGTLMTHGLKLNDGPIVS